MQKRHHTVPRCYLQNFTDKNGHLWVLDTKDNIFSPTPENILVESHFYTITLKNGEKSLFIEDSLANIEGDYAAIFTNKISKDLFLTDEERAKVSIFIATFLLRTKPKRESTREMLISLKNTMEEWKDQSDTDHQKTKNLTSAIPSTGKTISMHDIDTYLENYEEEHSVSILKHLSTVAQLIFDMKWSVWKAGTGKFVTSDDPLVLIRPESIKKYGVNSFGSRAGLIYKDVELTLPLSKERLLFAGWILEEDTYFSVEDKMVDHMNYRTITHSSERVIASSENQVKEIMAKYTETKYKKTLLE